MKRAAVSGMAIVLAAAAALAADAPAGAGGQASIPFANMGGIRNWRAVDEDTLYIEGRNGKWYRAELMMPCLGLNFADAIGFVVEPTGHFDRFSSIVVEGRQCHVRSLTESAGPPQSRSAGRQSGTASGANPPQAATDPRSGTGTESEPVERGDGSAATPAAGGDEAAQPRRGATASGEEARIPFPEYGGIDSWRPVDDDTLYIKGRSGQWYRAELMGPCIGLRHKVAIGFEIRPAGSFDRFSSIIVDGQRCPLRSLTKIESPPDERRGAGAAEN